MTLKMLPASSYLKHLFKEFRSLNTVNMGSVGQRASKLLAVKVGGLKKKTATGPHSNLSARFEFARGQIVLKVFQHQKILTFLKLCQEARSILSVGSALSK